MSKKISAADLFEDVEIDLWGNQFLLREGTLKVGEQYEALQKQLQDKDENEEATALEMATIYVDMLDIMLEPVAGESGKKTKAKTILLGKYKANEIGLDRIIALSNAIQAEAEKRGVPTPASTDENAA